MASTELSEFKKSNVKENVLNSLIMLVAFAIFLYPHLRVLFQGSDRAFLHVFSGLLVCGKVYASCLSVASLLWIGIKSTWGEKPDRATLCQWWVLFISASLVAFNVDVYSVFYLSKRIGFSFNNGFLSYWSETVNQYAALYIGSFLVIVLGLFLEGRHKPLFGYDFLKRFSYVLIFFIPLGYVLLPLILSYQSQSTLMAVDTKSFLVTLNTVFATQSMVFIISLMLGLKQEELSRGFVTHRLKVMLTAIGLLFAFEMIVWLKYALSLKYKTWPYHFVPSWGARLGDFASISFPLIFLAMIAYALWRFHHQKSKLGEDEANVSSDFGSASFASRDDLKKADFYNENLGIIFGVDKDGSNLYAPLTNKLIISPPGGGKTTASSIPLLLQYDGPVFALDVKGELWAVTASHRQEKMGRQVIAMDPFKIIQQKSFSEGKHPDLLQEYHINPFDWLPEEKDTLDRVINAFASSFLVMRSDSHNSHFEENAKILIRGYIDYLARKKNVQKSLPMLFKLLSGSFEENQSVNEEMIKMGGRAMAAANQIGRVGANERGSIFSTTYRQIDWLGDSNISRILNESNFDLKDFLKGKMDIYVIIPEDQIKEHGRLMRMMMSLLMGQIIQADPTELPDKKMVFLLEELAQMGAYPDVELCIEVLRARNVVVWSVFQTLSQIDLFEKPDLFKSMPLKQIFATDDVETMEWIQALVGKKTILTKGKSQDKGKSRDSRQWFGGSISSSRGESIHETGVDLLPVNEIREMDEETQLILYKNMPLIRCKKAQYFNDEMLRIKASRNPLA